MFQRINLTAIALVALVACAGAGAGCSASTRGEKMVESFAKTRDTLGAAQGQVAITLATLQRLRMTHADDMNHAFGRYKDAVAELEKQGTAARRRADSMKEESDAHIQAWQSEMASIKDPSIKASLDSRKGAVRSNFKLVQMYSADARKAYDPFLSTNKQIVQALSIDLSPAAITSLAGPMDRAMTEGQSLNEKIAAMQMAMNNMANGVSPIGLD